MTLQADLLDIKSQLTQNFIFQSHVHPVRVVCRGGSKGYRLRWFQGGIANWSLNIIMLVISRWASVSQVNYMLREQLDQAGTVNQGLTESLWKAREDVDLSDLRLRREQEVRKNTNINAFVRKSNRESSSVYIFCILCY